PFGWTKFRIQAHVPIDLCCHQRVHDYRIFCSRDRIAKRDFEGAYSDFRTSAIGLEHLTTSAYVPKVNYCAVQRAMRLFTIGFPQRSAEDFFSRLHKAGVKRIVDVRLHNASQIAGFAKASDLPYFLRAIAGIDYLHETAFAPTDEILDTFKKK